MTNTHGHPVLIIGAGRGGHALLEMFLEDNMVRVVGIADVNPDAPGLQLARQHGIPTYASSLAAMEANRHEQDCIVYNLTHNDKVAEQAEQIFGGKRVASGPEVKLFWQIVTHLKQTKHELEESQQQLQAIISNVMDGIITIDEKGVIVGFNPAAEQIFGYREDEVVGRNVKMLLPASWHAKYDELMQQHLNCAEEQRSGLRGCEMQAMRKSGEAFPMELSASEMWLGGQRYFIGIVRDITERKQAEERIAHLAHYDYLTDLPNRALFLDILEHSVALARRNRRKLAVLFLDLDGFKQVNDTLGHEAGDLLLKGVSVRLKEAVRASDTVARLGGDEFVMVLDDIGSHDSAALVAGKVLEALQPPFDLQGQPARVGGSVGIALFPDDGSEPERLLQRADQAMYLAKQSGKNTLRFYHQLPRPAAD